MNLNETLQQAIACHHAGQLPEAEELYLNILQADPGHPDANHNLGLMALQLGKAELGLPYLQVAWEADPSIEQYWLSLTECLLAMGHPKDALPLIEEALKRGVNSPQARQLLARANGSYDKALPPALDVQEVMALANSVCPAELEQRIKPLIDLYPDWAFGWNTLGVALQQQGKDGVAAIRQAVDLMPNDAEMHNNLGMLLKGQGMIDEALLSFRKALQIKPKYAKAHFNMATTLQSKGNLYEAIASLRQALKIKPDADTYNKLGVFLQANGQLEDALKNLRRAIKINPNFVEAHNNLGLALQKQGKLDEALSSMRKALEIDPGYADAYCNLGLFLQLQGRHDEAHASLCHALELDPDNADRHLHLGLLQKVQCKPNEAVASFCQAIKLKPDLAQALNGLGSVLFSMGHFDAALASIKCALTLKPDYYDAYLNLGALQRVQGKLEEASASYRKALEIQPDTPQPYNNLGLILADQGQWSKAISYLRRAVQLAPQDAQIYASLLFNLSHDETVDARTLFAEHCRFADKFEAHLRAGWPLHNNSRDPERCLQVGFVSADLCNHAVASFIEPVLAHLAGYPQLSLHAYSNNATDDSVTQRLRGYVKHWHPIAGLSDATLAEKIRTDGIDILIDLSGHTAKHRLLTFARKPAPVQASWMGYPGTTGLQAMDYYLADRFFLPPGQFDAQFTEKIVRMPAGAPFLPFEGAPPVNPLPALGNGYVTFGSFNRPTKLSRPVIALWAQLLRALPDSRMVLGAMPEEGKYDTLVEWFAQEGIVLDRLIFHPRSGMNYYMSLHQQVDICLDTFPYNGGTTTLHALWMGVPTLTMAGSTAAGRPGASILGHVGLEAFIANDAADFVQKGLSCAGNLAALSDIRAGLRERFAKSAMGQPAVVAAGVERALRIMWRRWCAGLPPESFEVSLQDINHVMQEASK